MKYVLVTYTRSPKDGTFTYPKAYNAKIVHGNSSGSIQYDFSKGFDAAGKAQCLVLLSDALADEYDASDGMGIVTLAQAEAWLAGNGDVARIPDYDVDEPTVSAIRTRIAAGLTPTAREMRMLDPNDALPGVRARGKKAADIFRTPDADISTGRVR